MRTVLVVLLSAVCAMILAACALLTQTLDPPAPAPDPAKVACDAFRTISWFPGDKGAAAKILVEVKDGTRAIDEATVKFLRSTLGDTDQTIFEVRAHNAAYRAICPAKPNVPAVKVTAPDSPVISAYSRTAPQQQ